MIDRRLLASAHGHELVRVVSHLPDEEIVRLAQSCRKPKRGEAFARSVEGLREQVNEILNARAAPNAPPAARAGRPEQGPRPPGAGRRSPEWDAGPPTPLGGRNVRSLIPGGRDVPSPSLGASPPISLFQEAVRSAAETPPEDAIQQTGERGGAAACAADRSRDPEWPSACG